MKTSHLLLILFSLLSFSNFAFGQDEFYQDNTTQKTENTTIVATEAAEDIFDEENYLSEQDYKAIYSEEVNTRAYNEAYSEEIYPNENNEDSNRKLRNRRIAGEIVGEILYHFVFGLAVVLSW
ncbi:MAG TPA: hypothetical protein VKZ45_06055 [Vicingaceae bacterium]|jgi:hypothetical protein|nr:hypothetical protein [Vicingaceae bacterium]